MTLGNLRKLSDILEHWATTGELPAEKLAEARQLSALTLADSGEVPELLNPGLVDRNARLAYGYRSSLAVYLNLMAVGEGTPGKGTLGELRYYVRRKLQAAELEYCLKREAEAKF